MGRKGSGGARSGRISSSAEPRLDDHHHSGLRCFQFSKRQPRRSPKGCGVLTDRRLVDRSDDRALIFVLSQHQTRLTFPRPGRLESVNVPRVQPREKRRNFPLRARFPLVGVQVSALVASSCAFSNGQQSLKRGRGAIMDKTDIQAGRELAGRYKLISLLGQGGMGSVWKAEHLALGSDVAVKLIDPSIAENEHARERFVREARAAAKLRSPHVVQILDYGVDGEVPFIVMEMLRGESLADRLERVGRLAPEETARIMSEVARALTRAHEAGIIHRDLKPDNVFLTENDDTEVAKVLDFGVARIEQFSTDQAGMTSTGAVLGTPYYMSPEQAEGSKMMDHRTDIWAMAVMTYECIVGVRPFVGETLGALFVSICSRDIPVPSTAGVVPVGFDAWFAKGTARVVADRFRTAREAARALREVCHVQETETESSLVDDASLGARTLVNEAGDSVGQSGTLGQGSESTSADAESVAVASSTAGLAHTALEIPGARKSPPLAVVLAGLGAIALVVGLLAMRSGEEESQTESVGAVQAAVASEVEKQPTPEEAAVEVPTDEEDEPPASDESEDESEPLPPPAPAPVPDPAPPPKPAPRPAPEPRPVAAPAPVPRPAPPAAPRPAPAPRPARVNLGI